MSSKENQAKPKKVELKQEEKEETFDYRNIIILIVAGGIAGIGVDLALFPVDTIKTRFMASTDKVDFNAQSEDGSSMYDGLLSSLVASFPSSAAFMLFYEFFQYLFRTNSVTNRFMSLSQQNAIAAAIGEVFQGLVRNPCEVIKTNLQIGKHGGSMVQAITDIYQHQGLQGFYVGYYSLVLRDIPFGIIQFPMYDLLKTVVSGYQGIEKDQLGGITMSILGSIAGAFSGFVVTPLDVLKTRQMTYDVTKQQPGTFELLQLIISQDGVAGLFKGGSVRCMYMCLGGFAYFGIYERVKSFVTKLIKGDEKEKDEKKKVQEDKTV